MGLPYGEEIMIEVEPCGHSPRVWRTNRQTDRRTENYDHKTVQLRRASHGKNRGYKEKYKISPTLFNNIINESKRKLNKTFKSRTGDPDVLWFAGRLNVNKIS